MKRLGWTIAVLLVLLVLMVPLDGQGWSMTGWWQRTIALQAERIDRATAVQGPDTNMRGYIDQTWFFRSAANEDILGINGWGFACGESELAAVDVMLNGLLVDGLELMSRHDRPDVFIHPGIAGWCPQLPYESGMHMEVPLGQLLPGGWLLRWRLWNAAGHSFTTDAVYLDFR